MRLPVVKSAVAGNPWFADGLRFTCSQCGNCCSGAPGVVWITRQEIASLAVFLGISRTQLIRKYCRRIGRQYSLKEVENPPRGHDCIFIREIPSETGGHPKLICSVYEARPLQCRTWPFWEGNLASIQAWERAARKCPGMDRGEFFDRERIENLRDARDWPEKPPGS